MSAAHEPASTPPSSSKSPPSHPPAAEHPHPKGLALALGALGVVFGDIGTSPLYAVKECFSGEHAVKADVPGILGVMSLIVWALTLVVAIKYLMFVMRADNHGEGGILALLALVPEERDPTGAKKKAAGVGFLTLLVLFGAALLYGDGVITPAISVLSAMEGLSVATTALDKVIVPLTLVTLIALFLVQSRGTAGIGKVFGPVMLLWFTSIGVLGAVHLVKHPYILHAVNPIHAVRFMAEHKVHGFLVLGSVVLSITGAEALYADMGHFGRGPIRQTWFALVFPALLLNYFGQGAYLLEHPSAGSNPFYSLVPRWGLYPMVALATAATVVASQALISGAYSLTQQAVQLGFFPRVTIVHTSKHTEGQIYVPEINNVLLVACVGLVLAFKNSSALAAAYGIAVTGTMGITTICYYVVITKTWKWPQWKALPLLFTFLGVDLAFFSASATKFIDGGWFPVLAAAGVFTVMTTWQTGRRHLAKHLADAMLPLQVFLDDVNTLHPVRVKGTAVFMAANPNGVPPILLHHFKHNQSLHEQIVLLTVALEHVPEIPREERVSVEELAHGFFRVKIRTGFMQQTDVPMALLACMKKGLRIDPARTSYFLGRETLLTSGKARMMKWRKTLFAFISRNARPATAYFGLPPNRVVELGMQIDL
jgi:KUP system potassium uptake protein